MLHVLKATQYSNVPSLPPFFSAPHLFKVMRGELKLFAPVIRFISKLFPEAQARNSYVCQLLSRFFGSKNLPIVFFLFEGYSAADASRPTGLRPCY